MASKAYGNYVRPQLTQKLYGSDIKLKGTSLGVEPSVQVGKAGVTTYPYIGSLILNGSPEQHAYGDISLAILGTNLAIAGGVHMSYGNLEIISGTHDATFLYGDSTITNNSSLLYGGGRYHNDPLYLNGTLTVDKHSTADIRNSTLLGNGTINIEGNSEVDIRALSDNISVNVDKGMLFVYGWNGPNPAHGFIQEGSKGTIDIQTYGAANAQALMFHRDSGIVDLVDFRTLNSTGPITSIRLAGTQTAYATPDGHGGMDITTARHANSLPTIFEH